MIQPVIDRAVSGIMDPLSQLSRLLSDIIPVQWLFHENPVPCGHLGYGIYSIDIFTLFLFL